MKDFIKLIENLDFIKFIQTEYFSDSNMTDEEKLNEVGSSLHDFAMAMKSFKLNGGKTVAH